MCRVMSFVLLYVLVLTFVVVEWSFVVVLYLSSYWFVRFERLVRFWVLRL